MSVLEYVLDGLEQALELERELGVRTVEIDRSLLSAPKPQPPTTNHQPLTTNHQPLTTNPTTHDFLFLHDRPLSAGGVEMMAKIIVALGRTAETAPIIINAPIPKAKVYVVLGARAMRKFFPEMKGEPGAWGQASDGTPVLITYSPEFILRYGEVTPAVQKIKHSMWQNLKAVKQRIAQ